jgi:hypothetical protein
MGGLSGVSSITEGLYQRSLKTTVGSVLEFSPTLWLASKIRDGSMALSISGLPEIEVDASASWAIGITAQEPRAPLSFRRAPGQHEKTRQQP